MYFLIKNNFIIFWNRQHWLIHFKTSSNYSHDVKSDEEYYDEKCIDFFRNNLETVTKMWEIYFSKNKKNYKKCFNLRARKSHFHIFFGWICFISILGLKEAQVTLYAPTLENMENLKIPSIR